MLGIQLDLSGNFDGFSTIGGQTSPPTDGQYSRAYGTVTTARGRYLAVEKRESNVERFILELVEVYVFSDICTYSE